VPLGDGAGHHHRRADIHRFLPPAPFSGDPPAGLFDWLFRAVYGDADTMFNWTSRPSGLPPERRAAGLVLVVMTLSMNALAIYIRYRLRKKIKW